MSPESWNYLIAALVGAVFFAGLLFLFRSALSTVLLKASKVTISGPAGFKIVISGQAAAGIAADVLAELQGIMSSVLTAEEKQLFLKIVERNSQTSVVSVLPSFNRDPQSQELKWLRALRGVNLIQPVPEGSRWGTDTQIRITRLGRIVAKHERHLLEP